MPRGDITGPAGMGPLTGRRAGYCAGFGAPGYVNPVYGRGFGMGFGRGWGFRAGGFGMGFGRGRGFRAGGFGRGWTNRFYGGGLPGRAPFGAYEPVYPHYGYR